MKATRNPPRKPEREHRAAVVEHGLGVGEHTQEPDGRHREGQDRGHRVHQLRDGALPERREVPLHALVLVLPHAVAAHLGRQHQREHQRQQDRQGLITSMNRHHVGRERKGARLANRAHDAAVHDLAQSQASRHRLPRPGTGARGPRGAAIRSTTSPRLRGPRRSRRGPPGASVTTLDPIGAGPAPAWRRRSGGPAQRQHSPFAGARLLQRRPPLASRELPVEDRAPPGRLAAQLREQRTLARPPSCASIARSAPISVGRSSDSSALDPLGLRAPHAQRVAAWRCVPG